MPAAYGRVKKFPQDYASDPSSYSPIILPYGLIGRRSSFWRRATAAQLRQFNKFDPDALNMPRMPVRVARILDYLFQILVVLKLFY